MVNNIVGYVSSNYFLLDWNIKMWKISLDDCL